MKKCGGAPNATSAFLPFGWTSRTSGCGAGGAFGLAAEGVSALALSGRASGAATPKRNYCRPSGSTATSVRDCCEAISANCGRRSGMTPRTRVLSRRRADGATGSSPRSYPARPPRAALSRALLLSFNLPPCFVGRHGELAQLHESPGGALRDNARWCSPPGSRDRQDRPRRCLSGAGRGGHPDLGSDAASVLSTMARERLTSRCSRPSGGSCAGRGQRSSRSCAARPLPGSSRSPPRWRKRSARR